MTINALTFVGRHPETGEHIAGIITDDFDVENMPIYYQVSGSSAILTGHGKSVTYKIPEPVVDMSRLGYDFYIGNISGTGQSFLLKKHEG